MAVRERDQHHEPAVLIFGKGMSAIAPLVERSATVALARTAGSAKTAEVVADPLAAKITSCLGPLPVPWHRSVFGRLFPDVDRAAKAALAVDDGLAERPAVHAAGPQVAREFLAQRAALRLHEQREIPAARTPTERGSTSEAVIAGALVERLREHVRGSLLDADDAEYDVARSVYNGSIDRRPALVARPSGTADVSAAVKEARVAGLPVAVRGGGHSVAGHGTCDGGLLLDLSPKYGLTSDNLISANVVTADGTVVTASEQENEDLFFGIRGGSSNFGVVTSFEFRLHPVGPMLYGGIVGYGIDRAADVLRSWRDFAEASRDELGTGGVLLVAPPEEFVPERLHHQPVLAIFALWVGTVEEGERALQPFREANTPDFDLMGPTPYTGLQGMIDPFAPPGWQNYHRVLHLSGLSDEAIDAFVTTRPEKMPPMTECVLFRHGGAVSRVPAGASAAGHRDAAYMFHPIACWQDPADNDRYLEWVYTSTDTMEPFTTGGVYLNFTGEEGEDKVRAGYDRETWTRLVALKDKYDPTNIFRFNQNIPPSSRR